MRDMIRSYGRFLVALFFVAAALWAALLILLPQVAMLEASLVKPNRQLDSGVAAQLAQDASTCRTVLERNAAPRAPAGEGGEGGGAGGGLAVPSIGGRGGAGGGLSVPTIGGGAATPSLSGSGAARPYVLQCDRADTMARLFRGEGETAAYLAEEYGLEKIAVDPKASLEEQLAQADAVRRIAEAAVPRLRAIEAEASPYGFENYAALFAARAIPLSEASREAERASLQAAAQRALGLRFERDGVVHVRLGLVTLLTTLFYAACATLLALIVCYPIAYNLALASGPRKAAWLLLALLVPYAIVELMRIYAWLSIIENGGLINRVLAMAGVIDLDDPIEFKRSPLTVFLVLVYTYILFMMFPLVNVMSTLDRAQIEAGRDLGAATWRIHRRIVIPHTKPGIAVGCIATFMLAAGAFSVPRIISRGLQGQWYAQTIYDKFFESSAVNAGAAYAFAFTLICFVLIFLFMLAMRARLTDFVRA